MDRKISDEELDRVAAALVKNFALQDDELDEIADSPALRRGVRRLIEEETSRRARSWFAVFRAPALAFGVAAALLIGCVLAFSFLNSRNNENLTAENRPPAQSRPEITAPSAPGSDVRDSSFEKEKDRSIDPAPAKVSARRRAPQQKAAPKNQREEISPKTNVIAAKKEIAPESAVAETKTDFIALGFAGGAESGQIVRVKVPSAMMVSLGVKASVEKESELVSAEVLVGDDGVARAIRFIR